MKMRTNDKKTFKAFENKGFAVEVNRCKIDDRQIRYLVSGNRSSNKLVLFCHGAPGSSDNFFKLMHDSTLQKNCVLIALDRLGYGFSDYGRAETSLEVQASCLISIIQKYPAETVVLVGHSFGGPIIAKAAMDRPDLIDQIIMVGPAIDPENEKIFKIGYLAKIFPFRQMTPGGWKVAADEKFSHVEELKKLLPGWETLEVPVVHIHGDKDMIVPVINVDFSINNIPEDKLKVVKIPGENHFIPFSRPDYILAELYNFMALWPKE
jgi:pimeloyl-ACP methyl ester carboxylesterase